MLETPDKIRKFLGKLYQNDKQETAKAYRGRLFESRIRYNGTSGLMRGNCHTSDNIEDLSHISF